MLEAMKRRAISATGRKDESTEKFYNGDCAITPPLPVRWPIFASTLKFNYGVGMMPYDADVKGAPQERHYRREGQP